MQISFGGKMGYVFFCAKLCFALFNYEGIYGFQAWTFKTGHKLGINGRDDF